MKTTCEICPHHCALEEGQIGFCGARENCRGNVVCANYGQVTALALDPIEKKPLRHFYPGSKILSVGSYGCNLRCPFCQNYEISMADAIQAETIFLPPEALVQRAEELIPRGNIGIAYTYNEPLVGYEYVRDCAMLAREKGLKNVVVTNGYICSEPFCALLPWIDAWNIDLKGFQKSFYEALSGDLETVKRNIAEAATQSHVEVTTLIVPGKNDTEQEMRQLSQWLSSIDRRIPLHVTRFFPRYHMEDCPATSVRTVNCLAGIARESLENVYVGNC